MVENGWEGKGGGEVLIGKLGGVYRGIVRGVGGLMVVVGLVY